MKTSRFITKKLLPFLLLPCMMLSCNMNKGYVDESSIVIPDSVYAFFPDKETDGLDLYSTSTNAESVKRQGRSTTFAVFHFMKEYTPQYASAFERLIEGYKKEAIDSLKPTDDSYFIIMYEEEMKKAYGSTLRSKLKESIGKHILPSFHRKMIYKCGITYNFTTVCGLPDDYRVLIMKSGRKYVLPDNDIWKFDWSLLPVELKHGYTSGVAYRNASDMIIYWCMAW